MELYGKQETLRYYYADLFWGAKLYQELGFVLVEMSGIQSILASTNLTLEPVAVIRLYSYRFRIEHMFLELKQQIGAFCYHFWSKAMPKLNYYQKKSAPSPLEQVENEKERQNIVKAVRATEMHMIPSKLGVLRGVLDDRHPHSCLRDHKYLRTASGNRSR